MFKKGATYPMKYNLLFILHIDAMAGECNVFTNFLESCQVII